MHRRTHRHASIVLVMLLAAVPLSTTIAQQAPYRPIEQRMSADLREASGLNAMTPDQLAVLNAWLRQEQEANVEQVRASIEEQRKGFGWSARSNDDEPIVSKLTGMFQGWDPGTVFTLHNGQSWQVIDTPPYYVAKRASTRDPAVSISPSALGGWRLQVEGHAVRATVRRRK